MRRGLTELEWACLNGTGFLLFSDVLSPPEVADLGDCVDALYARHGGEPETGWLELRNCVAHDSRLLRLVEHSRMLPMVVDILGPNIKLRSSHLDVRPPLRPGQVTNDVGRDRLGRKENWHVDGPLFGYPHIDGIVPLMEVKVGFFLTDLTRPDAGNLCLVSGTHTRDYRALMDPQLRIPPERVYRVQVPAGSAILFRSGVWHCVAPNLSPLMRKVLYYAYTYRWIEPSDYLAQPDALLATLTPVQRQLLGAPATPDRDPLGEAPDRTPCAFSWDSRPEDLPLLAMFEEVRAQRDERRAVNA